ncbi:serine/threonine protein kinase [Legionella wadsworthii]|uniref:Serine/threonine protein kinase n=1 Tax=Legionella wadsworthii TaxID=28088 RepID=A0A378LP83_9GAMM|nr:hypothetical protein [Legionella wadsworthii]STY28573.1 serine/threonine protein kinase [Legionella wadsworthii]
MTHEGKDKKTQLFTLFPVMQQNGRVVYYASDFSEKFGGSVYKGFPCILKAESSDLKPRHITKEELVLDESKPVSIKLYDEKQHPSAFQHYASEKAVLKIEGKDVLIMDFIDGFHIYPDLRDNPELNQFTFLQAVEVAWQFVLKLNHLHYNNTSGPPIVHGDITGMNIKIKMNVIEDSKGKKYALEASYLDLDYAKPITDIPQKPQGTPEHIALEILNGDYSESSDFFALSPLLLSIFGAQNPFKKIIEFRNKHPHMKPAELVRTFRTFSFCADGLFDHFKEKPNDFICGLIKKFILQMGENNKTDRPTPNAILEFFTALRQLTLLDTFNESSEEKDWYVLRLCIAAKDEHYLFNKTYLSIFFNMEENLQERLINLMSPSQCILLYDAAKINKGPCSLLHLLRKNIAVHLMQQIPSLKASTWPRSLFSPSITAQDILWLITCFDQNNSSLFYSVEHENTRKSLLNCREKKWGPFISVLAEGFKRPTGCPYFVSHLSTSPRM